MWAILKGLHPWKMKDSKHQQLEVIERWINYHLEKRQLSRRTVNVLQDLQDGEFFIIFLEALTGDVLPRISGLWHLLMFFTYWRRRWNLEIAFSYLEQQQVNLGNVSIKEILSGNPDGILRLIGNLVAHYEIQPKTMKYTQRIRAVETWLERVLPRGSKQMGVTTALPVEELLEMRWKVKGLQVEVAETLDCFSPCGTGITFPDSLQHSLSQLRHLSVAATLHEDLLNIIECSVNNASQLDTGIQKGEQQLLEVHSTLRNNLEQIEQYNTQFQSLQHEVNKGQEFYQEIGSNIKEAENLMERMRDCGQKPIAQLAQYMESLKHLRHRWCRVNQGIDSRVIILEDIFQKLSRYQQCHQRLLTHFQRDGNMGQSNTPGEEELELLKELVESAEHYGAACKMYEVQAGVFGCLVQSGVWPWTEQSSSMLEASTHQAVGVTGSFSRCSRVPVDSGLSCAPVENGNGWQRAPSAQWPEGEEPGGSARFSGLKSRVTVEGLVGAADTSPWRALGLQEGEVSSPLHSSVQGSSCVAGALLLGAEPRRLSIYECVLEGRVWSGTGMMLLEAQAATGCILDAAGGQRLTVRQAVSTGLVGRELTEKLLAAERAVTGYTDPDSGQLITLLQAMRKELLVPTHALRLLEAQVVTGGIIEPHHSHRLPVDVAYQHGLLDQELFISLSEPSTHTKGFFHPDTLQNLTYLQMSRLCVQDPNTGLLLLPISTTQTQRSALRAQAQSLRE